MMNGLISLFGAPSPGLVDQMLGEMMSVEERSRQNRYRTCWDVYNGDMPEPLKKTKSDPKAEDNLIVSYGNLIVNTTVDWLFGDEPTFQLDPTKETAQEAWVNACWAANRKLLTLKKTALNGAVTGHVFLKIKPRLPYPRLIVLDPATVSVRYDPDDVEFVTAYVVQYTGLDASGKPTVYRQRIERDGAAWVITDERSAAGGGAWITTSEEAWPFPFAPIVDWQHTPMPNEYYGQGELEPVIVKLNRAVNFGFSNNNRIQRIHGAPQPYGKGFTAQNLKVGPDEMLLLPDNGSLGLLEMQNTMEASYGHLDRLTRALFTIARVPQLAVGNYEGISDLSGTALRVYFRPLLQKIDTLRLTYGEGVAELNMRLLAVGGKGENLRPKNVWPELLPADPIAEAQAYLLHQQLGVSKKTILGRLGYDPAAELAAKLEEDDTAAETAMRRFDRGTPGDEPLDGEEPEDGQA